MTVQGFLSLVWEMLIGRLDGPFTLRLILQPTMAALFAIRSAVRDAREGRPPFFLWSVFSNAAGRSDVFGQVRRDVGKVFIAATVLDMVYEWKVYHWIYPLQAVITATVLAIVPYLLICGPMSRILRRYYESRTHFSRSRGRGEERK